MGVFQFREFAQDDGRPGRTITLSGKNIWPLGYAELGRANLHEKLTIQLELEHYKVEDTNVDGFDKSKTVNATATLESKFTSRAIGLVNGGWLPSALAAADNDVVIFIDRNLVPKITNRFKGGKAVGVEPDFLDLFAGRSVRINPVWSKN